MAELFSLSDTQILCSTPQHTYTPDVMMLGMITSGLGLVTVMTQTSPGLDVPSVGRRTSKCEYKTKMQINSQNEHAVCSSLKKNTYYLTSNHVFGCSIAYIYNYTHIYNYMYINMYMYKSKPPRVGHFWLPVRNTEVLRASELPAGCLHQRSLWALGTAPI